MTFILYVRWLKHTKALPGQGVEHLSKLTDRSGAFSDAMQLYGRPDEGHGLCLAFEAFYSSLENFNVLNEEHASFLPLVNED